MYFKKRRGIKLPYNMQGFICFSCLTYRTQPKPIQKKIKKMCKDIGGNYEEALFALMTTGQTVVKIAQDYHCADSTLYKLRKRFYENW